MWPQVITAILALLIFTYLFFFSWLPLLPEWLQGKFGLATDTRADEPEKRAPGMQSEGEEVKTGSDVEGQGAAEEAPQRKLSDAGNTHTHAQGCGSCICKCFYWWTPNSTESSEIVEVRMQVDPIDFQ